MMQRSTDEQGDDSNRCVDVRVMDDGAQQRASSSSSARQDSVATGKPSGGAGEEHGQRRASGKRKAHDDPVQSPSSADRKSYLLRSRSTDASSYTSGSTSQRSSSVSSSIHAYKRGSGQMRGTRKQRRNADPMETPLPPSVPSTEKIVSMYDSVGNTDFAYDSSVLNYETMKTSQSQVVVLIAQLRVKIAEMKHRAEYVMDKAVLPYDVRRAARGKKVIQKNIALSQRELKKLTAVNRKILYMLKLRAKVIKETKRSLREEIESLDKEKEKNDALIRRGYINRIQLLRRYWPWRQLMELGDNRVEATFEEELTRGPRYRNVALQNNIEHEFIKNQIHWLEAYHNRECLFRREITRLDNLVDDLNDVNDLIESAITCSLCGLLFDEPVLFWPCGHSFCCACFDSLAIAPGMFRCSVCGSLDNEGYLHNIIVADTVAKMMFKDSGYSNLVQPMNDMHTYLAQFQRSHIDERLKRLRQILFEERANEFVEDDREEINISYRQY